jgi:hypothetical protein
MVAQNRESTLEFEIKSLDATRSVEVALPQVLELERDLQRRVTAKFPGAKVTLCRAEGLPYLPDIQHLLVHIDWDVLQHGAEQAAAGFAATEFLKLLKRGVQNLFAKRVPAPPETPTDSKKKRTKARPASKKSKKKKTRTKGKAGRRTGGKR